MKLFFKVLLGTLAIIIIAVIGFTFTFDPNDYKKDIVTLVKDQTGRDLSITGDISLSLFPWIGVDLGEIEISNAKGFGNKYFAKMSQLQIRAKLWPLFEQRLEADTIVLQGLMLNLEKNKKGISNWEDLVKNKTVAKTDAKKTAKKEKTQSNSTNLLGAIALNGVEIRDAQFNWHDQQQKQKISVKDIQINLGQLRPDTKIPFELQFHLQEKTLDTTVKFNSQLTFSSNLKNFSFHETLFASTAKLASLKTPLSPTIKSPLIQLDLNKQTFSAKKLQLSEGATELITNVSAKKIFSTPYLQGDLKLKTINPSVLAQRFDIKLAETSDKKALTQLNAKLKVKGTLENLTVSNIELQLDDTKVNGLVKIKKSPSVSSVNMTIDAINLDRYLPKASEKETTKNTSSTNEAALIPLALLNAFNVNADIKVNKIQIKKTHWTDFRLAAHSRNGNINISSLNMLGYDSKVQSSVKINASKNIPLLSAKLNIQNLKVGRLLNDFTGKDKLKGKASVNANFNTSGLKLSQLKQNLNGKLNINLKNGTLKGFDLHHQQKVLNAKLKRTPIPDAPKPAETKIANLSASAIIKKGILTNKDLRASTPLSRVAGRGTVNIAKERLNYIASVKFTSSTDIKFKTPFEKMKALPLDIIIKGTFDKPNVKVDFKKLLDQLVKREIKKQKQKIKSDVKKNIEAEKQKLKDKLKKDLEKKMGDKLKNIFKF